MGLVEECLENGCPSNLWSFVSQGRFKTQGGLFWIERFPSQRLQLTSTGKNWEDCGRRFCVVLIEAKKHFQSQDFSRSWFDFLNKNTIKIFIWIWDHWTMNCSSYKAIVFQRTWKPQKRRHFGKRGRYRERFSYLLLQWRLLELFVWWSELPCSEWTDRKMRTMPSRQL